MSPLAAASLFLANLARVFLTDLTAKIGRQWGQRLRQVPDLSGRDPFPDRETLSQELGFSGSSSQLPGLVGEMSNPCNGYDCVHVTSSRPLKPS